MAGGGVRLLVRVGQQALARDAFASGLIPRLSNLRPVLEEAVRFRQESAAEEFSASAEILPSGGRRPWVRTKQFFTTPPPAKTLQRRGRLRRAATGGAGSFTRITDRSAVFGISGAAVPYADVQRRGATIRITAKMRGFVLHRHGKTFKASTQSITIPARGFGGPTPETRRRTREAFLRYLARGRVGA